MKANAVPLLALFEKKQRLEVPLFQRQYVWSQEEQWEPLWEDIQRKFVEYIEGRKDGPIHFLGAMVLDQKMTPSTHVERRQVIDGQQRLTTLQIFLSAMRDFCRSQGCDELGKELENYTLNSGMMADKTVEQFKVWPTQLDRDQFRDVIGLLGRKAIETKYPLVKKKYARHFEPRPRMVEAYVYFSDQLGEFFLGTAEDPPIAAERSVEERIDECFQALKNALQVVAIDLEKDDDAQVIFETLNARGQPLLPADLLRNYIFLRAARSGEAHEDLYDKYWKGFDDQFWQLEVRQGRLLRPRSDLFMQHFLSSQRMVDVPVKHLFVEYKFWIDRQKPFASVAQELAALARHRDNFRRLLEPNRGDPIFDLSTFLTAFDISTAYPLLLFLMDKELSPQDWSAVTSTLESYLLRRAVLGWTTKSYNRTFLSVTDALQKGGATPDNLRKLLMTMTGESSAWPDDTEFSGAWMSRNAYELNNPKVSLILQRISNAHLNKLAEQIAIESPLTIEHIMPQQWIEHWPLPNGEPGLQWYEIWAADAAKQQTIESKTRHAAAQTFGNLTVLTQGLNSSVSNSGWQAKKPALLEASLLPINQQLHQYDTWNEASIAKRGAALLEKALQLWPRPGKGAASSASARQ